MEQKPTPAGDVVPTADQTQIGSLTGSEAADKLIQDSISPNTRRAYELALRQLDGWRDGRELSDLLIAEYLGHLDSEGRAPASAQVLVAAVRFTARLAGVADPIGPLSTRALAGYVRAGRSDRGRGQAAPLTVDGLAAVLAHAANPIDGAIASLLFQAGLRRSEVAALQWRDIQEAEGGLVVRIRTSKANPDGQTADIRFLKSGAAAAVRAVRPEDPQDGDRVVPLCPDSVGRRFRAAVRSTVEALGPDRAAAVGLTGRLTAHSGRIGLASELTRRGASAQEVMLAGGWRSARMVSHYSAGARAEVGAVSKYL